MGRDLPDRHSTIDTAAKTLAFGGAVASLDLCASALLLWVGVALQPHREFDMADLKMKKRRKLGVALPEWAALWKSETTSNHNWQGLSDYRHGQLHRIIRQDVTVYPTSIAVDVGRKLKLRLRVAPAVMLTTLGGRP